MTTTLRPMAGKCLINPDEIATESGGIIVPEYLRKVGRPTGILLSAGTTDKDVLKLIGKRILVRTAVRFVFHGQRYYCTAINQIIAVLDAKDSVRILDPIERCESCKSKGEGNMLLDHNGYCITCGLNKYGEHRDHRSMKVSGDEVEAFGHSAGYYLRQKQPKGKITSYPGQGKRSRAEATPIVMPDGRFEERTRPSEPIPRKIISYPNQLKRSTV